MRYAADAPTATAKPSAPTTMPTIKVALLARELPNNSRCCSCRAHRWAHRWLSVREGAAVLHHAAKFPRRLAVGPRAFPRYSSASTSKEHAL
jgi:hypothetical protein